MSWNLVATKLLLDGDQQAIYILELVFLYNDVKINISAKTRLEKNIKKTK